MSGIRGIDEEVDTPPLSVWAWIGIAVLCAALAFWLVDVAQKTDKEKAAGTLVDFYEGIEDGDGEQICGAMTPATQRLTVALQEGISGADLTCAEAAIRELDALSAEEVGDLGSLDQEDFEETIEIDGDRAVLRPEDGGPAAGIGLARIDGEWLIELRN